MDWTPGGLSSDIEDRRGDSGGGGGFGGGGLGLGGLVILGIISLITGRNFIGSYLSGSGNNQPTSQSSSRYPGSEDGSGPRSTTATDEEGGQTSSNGTGSAGQRRGMGQPLSAEDRSADLVSFVLDDTQKTWAAILSQQGIPYHRAKGVLYRGETYSGCGTAEAQVGPFYCPADEKIYIDLGFWDELKKFGGGTSDFAEAYVVAHEMGHHIQNLLGTEQKVRALERSDPAGKNHTSEEVELQADCFAGVWAHTTEQRGFVHDADINSGLQAAAAVGDDHLQRITRGTVNPDSFTHGTSAERQKWFRRGLDEGTIAACDTFGQTLE